LVWHVASLRELFRGDNPAPSEIHRYPPEYVPKFYFAEKHVLAFGDAGGDNTEGEFEEAFSNLRRRPDGRTVSELHFFLRQVAAGLLGLIPPSTAEFDVFGQLARSAGQFRMGHTSNNYMNYLRSGIGQLG